MGKVVTVNGEEFTIERVDSRNKNAVARVSGNVITIKLPSRWPDHERERAAHKLEARMLRRMERRSAKIPAVPKHVSEEQVSETAKAMAPDVRGRVYQLNAQHFQSPMGKVRLRRNITNWGSCSPGNNISINSALLFMPKELLDYVIIHELAHTRVRNHSKRFWETVALALPDYVARRKELRNYSLSN